MPAKKEKEEKVPSEFEDIPGLGEASIKKLLSKNIDTIDKLASLSITDIDNILGCGQSKAELILREALMRSKRAQFLVPASEYYTLQQRTRKYITTCSKELDKLLGGGLGTGVTVTASGEYGTGKSQLAMQLSVCTTMPEEKGGLDKNVLYIATEDGFSPKRICEMAQALGLDTEATLKKIIFARAWKTDDILVITDMLQDESYVTKMNLGLVVVDSIIGHFRSEFVGRGELASRQQKLLQVLTRLTRAATFYNFAVFLTNHVIARPEVLFGEPVDAAGGYVLKHLGGTQLWLKRAKDEIRIAMIKDSPELPPRSCRFVITQEGIRDVTGEVSESE